ncbi:unnamed protein product [Ceutorhynchus assimilis]|uniref:Lipase n=1 Tax=Ceutorhynchus assimilis TaxID=467358 RepID=A0A9N9QJP0_9CUCU|nr:unnamed protein product [Ceutorhynchus assimilis]
MTVFFNIKFVFILLCAFYYFKQINAQENLHFIDIVKSHGYPTEVYEVETEDGYLLDIFRVPFGRNSTTKVPNRYPLLLAHGLMGSAENFIIGGPTKALTYVLADHGYDVWAFNARGTWHSRKHRTLDPDIDMREFWRFTWHEIGYYDIPATIDFILNVTNAAKLHYIGHSQGTTVFFVAMSERPEYNSKINVMIGMGPSALLSHIKQPFLKFMAPMFKYLQNLAESLKVYEMIPKNLLSNDAVRLLANSFCDEKPPARALCSNALAAMAGFTEEQLDPDTINFIVSIGPGGASVYQGLHYAQLVQTGKFMNYDWGPKENKKRYNSSTPPEYNFSNIICPISLMYGKEDILIAEEDVIELATRLPNVIDVYKVPYEHWSHMDFVWAKDVGKYINKHIFRVLRKFN